MTRRLTPEENRALALTADRFAERHARAGKPSLSAMWRRIADRLRDGGGRCTAVA